MQVIIMALKLVTLGVILYYSKYLHQCSPLDDLLSQPSYMVYCREQVPSPYPRGSNAGCIRQL